MAQIMRPVVIAVICVGLFLILESLMLPKAMALKTSGFRLDNLRNLQRWNYALQRAGDQETRESFQEKGYDEGIEPSDAARAFRKQLAQIADYAYTVDDYFPDNSIEASITKRDNTNQAIRDLPCNCKSSMSYERLGDKAFPKKLSNFTCYPCGDKSECAEFYKCQEIYYDVPILKEKVKGKCDNVLLRVESSLELIPKKLSTRWCVDLRRVTVGCQCVNTYKSELHI